MTKPNQTTATATTTTNTWLLPRLGKGKKKVLKGIPKFLGETLSFKDSFQ